MRLRHRLLLKLLRHRLLLKLLRRRLLLKLLLLEMLRLRLRRHRIRPARLRWHLGRNTYHWRPSHLLLGVQHLLGHMLGHLLGHRLGHLLRHLLLRVPHLSHDFQLGGLAHRYTTGNTRLRTERSTTWTPN